MSWHGRRHWFPHINDPANLSSGQQALSEALRQKGLDGLFISLLTRLTLGESSDLGPDNMLVVPGADGRHQVVNIDVTGFRYDRGGRTPRRVRGIRSGMAGGRSSRTPSWR